MLQKKLAYHQLYSRAFKLTQHTISHIVYDNPSLRFLKTKHTRKEKEEGREREKSLECFVSCNYSPIIWSKYGITGHFVVQTAWL